MGEAGAEELFKAINNSIHVKQRLCKTLTPACS
ncbi:hypothetical protein M2282_002846 [Variovorax boronicumulans]|nr:hypothetical protein [Variovorax boronicumulans]